MKIAPRRWPFEAIELASRLVQAGRFDDARGLRAELDLLARAYGVDEMRASTLDDPRAAPTGYFATPADYYTSTEAQFTGLHSAEGSVHFGLDWDGRFRPDGFLEQARLVETVVCECEAADVLEIGSGKGYNSVYLARRLPNVSFTGVDLTPVHVRIARERAAGLPNLRFVQGDFHALAGQADGSLDVVFDVEAGCYSDTPERLRTWFDEVHRVLRPGGLFVTFGWCRTARYERLDRRVQLAAELVERAWVVQQFHAEDAWQRAAEKAGFVTLQRRDLRDASMPSVLRLYRQARLFYAWLASPARPVVRRLMRPATHNAVSALMLPYAYGLDALEYRMAVLGLA
jgi:SAM-dependent methyltransferase